MGRTATPTVSGFFDSLQNFLGRIDRCLTFLRHDSREATIRLVFSVVSFETARLSSRETQIVTGLFQDQIAWPARRLF